MWHEEVDLDFKHFHPVMFLKTETTQWHYIMHCRWKINALLHWTLYIKINYIIMPVARCTRYNIMWKVCQWFAIVLWFSTAFPGFLQQENWPPQYNWNIVESGVEPQNPRNCIINCAYNMCFVFICSIMKNKSKPWRNICNWNKLERIIILLILKT